MNTMNTFFNLPHNHKQSKFQIMFKNLVKKCYLAGRPPFLYLIQKNPFFLNSEKINIPSTREQKLIFKVG